MKYFCGNCRFMKYEDVDGWGICSRFDTNVYCGDEGCKVHEERIDD